MFGKLGSTLSQALSTEFFHWFHLEQTGESKESNVTYHVYQPTAQQFHDLVRVTLTADKSEALKGVKLEIRRSFIDNPKHYTLAADISTSFLRAALSPGAGAALGADVLTHIRAYQPAATSVATMRVGGSSSGGTPQTADDLLENMKKAIAAGGPVYATMKSFKQEGSRIVPVDSPKPEPLLPGEGEPAYLVYCGKRRQLEQKLGSAAFRMANSQVAGTEQLTISLSSL